MNESATTVESRPVAAELDLEPREHPAPAVRPVQPPMQTITLSPPQLLALAVEKGADLDQIERFMKLVAEWEAREAIKNFNKDFAAFKRKDIQIFKRTKREAGPLAGTLYANLSDVLASVNMPLADCGLSISWQILPDDRPDWTTVECVLSHVDGHSRRVRVDGPAMDGSAGGKSAIQAHGSAITYYARYSVKLILGIAEDEDDDDGAAGGESAGKGQAKAAAVERPPERQKQFDQWLIYLQSATTEAEAKKHWQTCESAVRRFEDDRRELYAIYRGHVNQLLKDQA